jgi:hypothetical protein
MSSHLACASPPRLDPVSNSTMMMRQSFSRPRTDSVFEACRDAGSEPLQFVHLTHPSSSVFVPRLYHSTGINCNQETATEEKKPYKIMDIPSVTCMSLQAVTSGTSMACKRSAVRSRLAPPPVHRHPADSNAVDDSHLSRCLLRDLRSAESGRVHARPSAA